MSKAKGISLDECLARIRRNKERSFKCAEWCDLPYEDVGRRLGAALLGNPSCTLQFLDLRAKDLLVARSSTSEDYPLLEYLGTNQCKLMKLGLNCHELPDAVQPFLRHVPNALVANRSLTMLKMDFSQYNDVAVGLSKTFLDGLALRPTGTLQVLELTLEPGYESTVKVLQQVLSHYFQTCRTNLRKLILHGMVLNMKSCELLFVALQASTNKSRAESLEFRHCAFDRKATELLGKLLQSETIQQGSGAVEVSIYTLYGFMFEYSLPPCLLGFFRIPVHGRIRVRELDLEWTPKLHLLILAYFLPKSLYLRKLVLSRMEGATDDDKKRLRGACKRYIPALFLNIPMSLRTRELLDAIRQNGSLHSIVFCDAQDKRLFSSAAAKRNLHAYLTRNRELPRILSHICCDHSEKHKGASVRATSSAHSTTNSNVELLPQLVLAASMAPAFAPTNVLIGLAAAAECMRESRPRRPAKRRCGPQGSLQNVDSRRSQSAS